MWENNFDELANLIRQINLLTWGVDPELKYLSIKIDTRDLKCTLYDRNGNAISSDRVRDAIERVQSNSRQT